MSRMGIVSRVSEQPWIRSYALAPRRLDDGHWVWLGAYEWRWQRPQVGLPDALNPPRVFTRKAPGRMQPAAERS